MTTVAIEHNSATAEKMFQDHKLTLEAREYQGSDSFSNLAIRLRNNVRCVSGCVSFAISLPQKLSQLSRSALFSSSVYRCARACCLVRQRPPLRQSGSRQANGPTFSVQTAMPHLQTYQIPTDMAFSLRPISGYCLRF